MTFQAKVTSKGQVTLPAGLRTRLAIVEGDTIEFFFDHLGRACLRRRVKGTEALLAALEPRRSVGTYRADDEAIAAAVLAKGRRARRRGRTGRR